MVLLVLVSIGNISNGEVSDNGGGIGALCAQNVRRMSGERLSLLGDSLTVYARERADVMPVRVKSCHERGLRIEVRTNATLSYLSLSRDELQQLRGKVSEWVRGDKRGLVSIYSDDRELGELVTSRYRERKEQDKYKRPNTAIVQHLDAAYETESGMAGKNIALWASHGLFYRKSTDSWIWQRAKLWTTVEDVFTFSYTYGYLVPMLEQAGAVVLQPRERDLHRAERVVTGGGLTQGLQMPVKDEYALYVRYKQSRQNSDKVVYTICHEGIVSRVSVNQQMGGGQWLYIGTYAFGQDSARNHLRIEDATGKGQVSHEGVKIGGGVGESGFPRYIEGARYWLAYNGVPDTVYTYEKKKSQYLDDLVSRGRWVNYMNEQQRIPIHTALAIHTDAGVREGDSIIGTLAIYSEKDKDGRTRYVNGGNRLIGRDLADYVQTQVVEDMRKCVCSNWARRELKDGVYAESRIPRVPALLVEMLSHQNQNDMRYGLDGRVKFVISRAIYKGLLRFLHEQDGSEYVVQPLPVQDFCVRRVEGSDSVCVSWRGCKDSLEVTADPTYYVLYVRESGSDWDNGMRVDCEQLTLRLERGKRYDFAVRAGNAGGVSMRSELLSAYISPKDDKRALIVNGFDRVCAPQMMDGDSLTGGIEPGALAIPYGVDVSYIGEQKDFVRAHEWKSDDDCGYGMCKNDYAGQEVAGNTFDYPLLHGAELERMGYSYVSQSLSSLGSVPRVAMLDLILGKQKEGIGVLTQEQRAAVERYLHGGGRLLLSGSYIGSGSPAESLLWARTVLHYLPKTGKASKNGQVEMQLSRDGRTYQLFTTPNETRIACESPDAIEPDGVSRRVGQYIDNYMTAGVATGNRILVLPFMMESVCEFESLYEQCVRFLETK